MKTDFIFKSRVPDALVYIREHPNCKKVEIQRIFGGNGESIDKRMEDLVSNGLVKRDQVPHFYRYVLTDKGERITSHIMEIEAIYSMWGEL